VNKERIEQAKGMPEEPEIQECHTCWTHGEPTCNHYDGQTVWLKDYDALRLSHQHLQDRLNRMEALLAGILDTYASVLSPQMCAEIDVALLAKLDGRE
jgi:hypothetical protein